MSEFYSKTHKKNVLRNIRRKKQKQKQKHPNQSIENISIKNNVKPIKESMVTIFVRDGRHPNSKATYGIIPHQEYLAKIPIEDAIQNKAIFQFELPISAHLKSLQVDLSVCCMVSV